MLSYDLVTLLYRYSTTCYVTSLVVLSENINKLLINRPHVDKIVVSYHLTYNLVNKKFQMLGAKGKKDPACCQSVSSRLVSLVWPVCLCVLPLCLSCMERSQIR